MDLDKSVFYEGPAKIGGVSFGFVRLQELGLGSWAGSAVAPESDAPGYKRFGIPNMPTVQVELQDGRQGEAGVTARQLAGFDREALLGKATGEAELYEHEEWFLEIRGSAPLPRIVPSAAADAEHDICQAFMDDSEWVWRCDGIRHCAGEMGRGYVSQEAAQAGYDEHAAQDHGTDPTASQLHASCLHPGWEYATTTGPRKQWDSHAVPPADGHGEPDPTWERNIDRGRDGWDRLDYTEESYWRRRRLARPSRGGISVHHQSLPGIVSLGTNPEHQTFELAPTTTTAWFKTSSGVFAEYAFDRGDFEAAMSDLGWVSGVPTGRIRVNLRDAERMNP